MNTADPNRRGLTTEECISSLETLFKAYQKDSEFDYQLNISNSPFNLLKKRLAQTSKKKTLQKYFERTLECGWQDDEEEFNELLNDGWIIKTVIPIEDEGSTVAIHYVLEKEVDK